MLEDTAASLNSLPRSPGRKIIRREEAQNWLDGYQFLAEGRRTAEELLERAQTAYDEMKSRGFAEGRAAGAAEGAALVADTVVKVDQYLASIEQQVAELSLSIVEQVLGTLADGEIMARVANQALAAFRREKHVRVRVSPAVLEDVQRALSAWPGNDAPGPMLVIEADPRLEPRQCTIVTEFAVVDASIDAQLNVVRRIFNTVRRP